MMINAQPKRVQMISRPQPHYSKDEKNLNFTVKASQSVGSLRNHDGYGDENVTSKYTFELFYLFRDYSILFALYNMCEVSYNSIGTDGFEVKGETERFTVVCPRCRQNLKFVHFT